MQFQTLRTAAVTCAFLLMCVAPHRAAAADIVLTASNVVDVHGHWQRANDATAAGGALLTSSDSGWQNTVAPEIAPRHYVDYTFTPQPHVAYRVWLRMRAAGGSKYNDSVFVQFSNARDTKNYARYRLGTAEGLLVNRQSCGTCALHGWGWYDGAYWLTQPSVLVFGEGSQTLRVQTREDGVQIDQIVLSPTKYLSAAPGAKDNDGTIVTCPPPVASTPLTGTPVAVPGTLAPEAFDEGGPGVAYHDTTLGNEGGAARNSNVDLVRLPTGAFALSNIDAGEWLNYRIQVMEDAEYLLEADVAAAKSGGKFHIDVNGQNVTGVLQIPNTGSTTAFTTIAQPIRLTAGTYSLRVVFDSKAPNTKVAAIRLMRPRSPYSSEPIALPGTIPAEAFDNGGQGLSWLDSTPGNAGGQLRTTDVDLFGSPTGGYFIGDTVTGEWVEYAVNVAQAATYVVTFDVAASVDGARISAQFGNATTNPVAVPNTRSNTAWTSVASMVALEAGAQFMRVTIAGGGVALRAIRVAPAPTFKTYSVPAGGNLQAAIDAAAPGDVVLLEPGATYVGNFKLRAKPGESERYITIRTATPDAMLPAADARITPASAPLLAKLRSPNNQPSLATEAYAHHYRVQFVEFLHNVNGYGNIIALGDPTAAQNTLAVVPHHLVLDRVYIHGDVTVGQKRGIALNSAHTTIVNSWIAEIKAAGQESQGIGGWNGPGPYLISNNFIEAATENIMFGGADPAIPDLVPSDITITRNHLYKPLAWKGTAWTVKNHFELKSAQRVLFDSNLLENNWLAAQNGYSIVLKSVNQDGKAPWSVTQHVTVSNNVIRHVASGVNILGRDLRYPALMANNIVIRNNLFEDVSAATYGGSGRFLQIDGGIDVTVDHNTVIADGATPVAADGVPTERMSFTNNVMRHNLYGVKGTGTAVGNATIAKFFPNGLFVGGIYIGGRASNYPPGNFFPAALDDVFADFAGGDYRLSPTSIYLGAASDGSNPGVNHAALGAALAAAQ